MQNDKTDSLNENPAGVFITNTEDKKIALEQYKVIADSINSANAVRENANNFWVTVNSLLISMMAYLKGIGGLGREQHELLIWSALMLGVGLCISWLSSLISVKSYNNVRDGMLIEIERNLPVKIFTASYGPVLSNKNKRSLTVREMFVPCMFLVGYFVFMVLLFWAPISVLK